MKRILLSLVSLLGMFAPEANSVVAGTRPLTVVPTVTCTRPSHLYSVDERAEFEITSPVNGTRVVAKLSRAYLPTIETVVTTTPARVSFGLGEPGFVVCEVWNADANGQPTGGSRLAGAGFEPSRLRTARPRPADYDAFWESAFREQEAIPPDFTSRPISNGLELVSCRTVWGTRMYGFLRMPQGKGPFPLQVTVGGGDSYFCEEAAFKRATLLNPTNCALLLIHLPAWEPSVPNWKAAKERNLKWYADRRISPPEIIYWNCEKGPRERWYYRCILGACRLIDHAVKRTEIDRRRVYYYGASTGGGYGVFLAAFSPHIRAAICEVPNYGNMAGPEVGRPSGEDDRGKYWKTSLYFDGAWCAPRIKCPVFMSCGYWDQCCCPETIYCIYNEIRAPKVLYDKVENGHMDCPDGYVEKRAAWLDAALKPRDGFAGMVADGRGELVTKPLAFTGSHLFVNAESRYGSVRAEILGVDGRPLPGFAADDCTPISLADTTKAELVFKGGDLKSLGAKGVRVRFLLHCATLYSFWISPSPKGESRGYLAAGGPDYPGLRDER